MFVMKKIMSFPRRISFLALSCFLLFLIFGCQATQGIYTSAAPEGGIALSRLAVLPFQDLTPEDPAARMTSCPLCGAIFQTDKLAPAAEQVVEEMVLTSFREYKQITLADPVDTAQVYARNVASGPANLPETLQKTGNELNVDAILVGYVFRYRERKGNAYSVEKPASVAFDLHLVRVKDGHTIWRGAFDKTQSSLMENMFQLPSFFSGGGKWVTAKELSADGLAAVLKTFPGIN